MPRCAVRNDPQQGRANLGSGSREFPDALKDEFMGRESFGLKFRVEKAAVDVDVENTATSRLQDRPDTQFSFKAFRKTCGAGLVVSLCTVGDGDVHGSSQCGCHRGRYSVRTSRPPSKVRMYLPEPTS